jgi:predicted DNA-binding transcriptional regulator AlpA
MLEMQNNPAQVPANSDADSKSKPRASIVLEGFLSREELAQAFGLSTRTLDRLEALRQGPPRVYFGRMILYKAESVRTWLLSREQDMKPPMKRQSKVSGPNF